MDQRCRRSRRARHWPCAALLCVIAALPAGADADADGAALKPFSASYAWIWHGVTVAVSTLKFEHQQGPTWSYASTSEPRGLARLYPARPRLDSTMRIDASGVRPLHYVADDGLGTKSRHADVLFDWDTNHATGEYAGVAVDLPLHGGEQDDMSIQIAMLVALRAGQTPEHLSMIDKNSVRNYQYQKVGEERLNTALGALDTVIYASSHAGSSRVTRFWCPPSRGYVPVKVEQQNEGKVEWSMEILRLSGY